MFGPNDHDDHSDPFLADNDLAVEEYERYLIEQAEIERGEATDAPPYRDDLGFEPDYGVLE